MSEPKFTRGPWRHYAQPDPFDPKLKRSYVLYGKPDAVNPDDGTFPPDQCVCGCGKSHWSCGDGNNAANAQLISCSPDLYASEEKNLEILKVVLESYKEMAKLMQTDADVQAALNEYDKLETSVKTMTDVISILEQRIAETEQLLKKARGEE